MPWDKENELFSEDLGNSLGRYLAEALAPLTKESIQAQRAAWMDRVDEVIEAQLVEGEQCGVSVGDIHATVNLRYNKDLKVFRLETIKVNSALTFPDPIKSVRLTFDLTEKL